MCNSYKEELLACNLTVLSHCPACKANGLDVLAANHPSLPIASSNPSPTDSGGSVLQEQAFHDINARLDSQGAKIEQLLELVLANNNRSETNSVLSSSSSPINANANGGSSYSSDTTLETSSATPVQPKSSSSSSSSSSRKRYNSNATAGKGTTVSSEEKRSRKSSSNMTLLETFFSQTWQDEDITNGSLDSILAQVSSIIETEDRIKLMKELRNQTAANEKSVGILMKGGFKAVLVDWFKEYVHSISSNDEENNCSSSQVEGFNSKYVNNLLITIDEIVEWPREELINNRLDKTIKACYKSCKMKGVGGESQFIEYLKLMWTKYRGLIDA